MAKIKVIAVLVGIVGGLVFPPLLILPVLVFLPAIIKMFNKAHEVTESIKSYQEERAEEKAALAEARAELEKNRLSGKILYKNWLTKLKGGCCAEYCVFVWNEKEDELKAHEFTNQPSKTQLKDQEKQGFEILIVRKNRLLKFLQEAIQEEEDKNELVQTWEDNEERCWWSLCYSLREENEYGRSFNMWDVMNGRKANVGKRIRYQDWLKTIRGKSTTRYLVLAVDDEGLVTEHRFADKPDVEHLIELGDDGATIIVKDCGLFKDEVDLWLELGSDACYDDEAMCWNALAESLEDDDNNEWEDMKSDYLEDL